MAVRSSPVRRTRSTQLRHTRRLIINLDRVLGRMRCEGLTLHLQHQAGQPSWFLSTGENVTRDLAALIINNPNIAPADFGLFPNLVPGQTWEFGA
jgi:hypothetical protein